jgi:hypothetical protein
MKRTRPTNQKQERIALYALGTLLAVRWILMLAIGH